MRAQPSRLGLSQPPAEYSAMEDAASRRGAGVRAVTLAAPQMFYRDSSANRARNEAEGSGGRAGEAPAARARAEARARARMQGEAGEVHVHAERKGMTTARARRPPA
jgi:hypothetical protein